jgi:hypothetical protein
MATQSQALCQGVLKNRGRLNVARKRRAVELEGCRESKWGQGVRRNHARFSAGYESRFVALSCGNLFRKASVRYVVCEGRADVADRSDGPAIRWDMDFVIIRELVGFLDGLELEGRRARARLRAR